ncbi:MAG: RluA family pseudouridine synthase [Clostridiales bacterium]|nr:RluA family pseudouridine synthase [Clostridiales bacterium]
MKSFIVNKDQNGLHVVKVSTEVFPGLKAADLYKALKHKDIRIDGKKISSDVKVTEGQEVQVWLPDSLFDGEGDKVVIKKDPDYKIVAETDGLLIVNKRQGLPVHSGKNTGEQNLIDIIRRDTGNRSLELVHRIDMNTGGMVMLAKNKDYLEDAIELFRKDLVTKRYRCLVLGVPEGGETVLCKDDAIMNEVSAFLEKTRSGEVYVHDTEHPGDLPITTRYRVLQVFKGAGPEGTDVSEIECELVTGRTHQIRAQFAHLGHPIVGDGNYGRNKDNLFFKRKDGGRVRYQQLFATSLLLGKIPVTNSHHVLSGRNFTTEPRYEAVIVTGKKRNGNGR